MIGTRFAVLVDVGTDGGADDSDPYDSYDEFFDTWKEET